jgi:iron(III) transport system ATP-binding protein
VTTGPAPDPRIIIRNVTKTYSTRRGKHVALDNVSLEIGAGEALVLLGPSGCGKTTLLRCVAGLEQPDFGEIIVHGKMVFSSRENVFLPPEQRRLSMVFQSYALWPHMTLADNIAYPLKNTGVKAAEIERRVTAALDLVGLGGYGSAYSGQLSGGQQQRVALARAIVSNEGIVLFDEPLSNLDAKVRDRLRVELLSLQREIGFSSLYVTHDQVEAMALADRIAVMSVGQIAQIGRSEDIYARPASRYVADFVGKTNEVAGTVLRSQGDRVVVDTPIGQMTGIGKNLSPGEKASVLFRPEHVRSGATFNSAHNQLTGQLEHTMFLGAQVECVIRVSGISVLMTGTDAPNASAQGDVSVSIAPGRVMVFPQS